MISESDARWLNITLKTCHEIAFSGFEYFKGWQSEASFILLLVNLNDALQSLSSEALRINFSDELPPGKDVTDQVSSLRNAACHIKSSKKTFPESGNLLHFARIGPGSPRAVIFGNESIGCEFPDDFALFYGPHRLLLVRHIRRAIGEAIVNAKPIVIAKTGIWIGP